MQNIKDFEDYLIDNISFCGNDFINENLSSLLDKLYDRTKDIKGKKCLIINNISLAKELESNGNDVKCIYFNNKLSNLVSNLENYAYVEIKRDKSKESISKETMKSIDSIFESWNLGDNFIFDYIINISFETKNILTYKVIGDLNFYIFNHKYGSRRTVFTNGKSIYYSFDEKSVGNYFGQMLTKKRNMGLYRSDEISISDWRKMGFSHDKKPRQFNVVVVKKKPSVTIDKVDMDNQDMIEFRYEEENGAIKEKTKSIGDKEKIIIGMHEPKIYAFTSEYANDSINSTKKIDHPVKCMKVGETNRGVKRRMSEWKYKKFEDLKPVKDWSAVIKGYGDEIEGKVFHDTTIHKILTRNPLFKDRNIVQIPVECFKQDDIKNGIYSREFLDNCSEKDVEDAIKYIKDMASKGRQEVMSELYDRNDSGDDFILPIHNVQRKFGVRDLQEKCVEDFVKKVNEGKDKLLMYAVMRFGKTYTAYRCMKEFYENIKREKTSRLVVVASSMVDVRMEWIKNINPYSDFVNYDMCDLSDGEQGLDAYLNRDDYEQDDKGEFVMMSNGLMEEYDEKNSEHISKPRYKISKKHSEWCVDGVPSMKEYLKMHPDKHIILFVSLADLNGSTRLAASSGTVKDRHVQFYKYPIDLLIFDEAHRGLNSENYGKGVVEDGKDIDEESYEGELEDKIKEHLNILGCVKLYLSGTPYDLMSGNKSTTFKNDELIARFTQKDLLKAKEKWDDDHRKMIWNKTPDENGNILGFENNPYFGIPEMLQFGYDMTDFDLESDEFKTFDVSFGELFKAFEDEKGNFIFKHRVDVLKLFELISGDKKGNILPIVSHPDVKNGNMCKHIVIVLPNKICCDALYQLFEEEKSRLKFYNNYNIIKATSSKEKINLNDVKKLILTNAEAGNRTITLTVRKMLTGVTIEPWDTMLYMKDCSKAQEYDQAKFRIMTPYTEEADSVDVDDDGNIKIGDRNTMVNKKPQVLFIDFHPTRCLNMMKEQVKAEKIIRDGNKHEDDNYVIDDLSEMLKYTKFIQMKKDKTMHVCTGQDADEIVENYRNHEPLSVSLKHTFDWGMPPAKDLEKLKKIMGGTKMDTSIVDIASSKKTNKSGSGGGSGSGSGEGKPKLSGDFITQLPYMNALIIRDLSMFVFLRNTGQHIEKLQRFWDEMNHVNGKNDDIICGIFCDDLGLKWEHVNPDDYIGSTPEENEKLAKKMYEKQKEYNRLAARKVQIFLQVWNTYYVKKVHRSNDLLKIIKDAQDDAKKSAGDFDKTMNTLGTFFGRLSATEVVPDLNSPIYEKVFKGPDGNFVIFNSEQTILDCYCSKVGEFMRYAFTNIKDIDINNYYVICDSSASAELNKKVMKMILISKGYDKKLNTIEKMNDWLNNHIMVCRVSGPEPEYIENEYINSRAMKGGDEDIDEKEIEDELNKMEEDESDAESSEIESSNSDEYNDSMNLEKSSITSERLETYSEFLKKLYEEVKPERKYESEGGLYKLKKAIENKWKNMKFDIVVGNPPYGSKNKGGSPTLHLQIMKTILDFCKDWLCFIMPSAPINKQLDKNGTWYKMFTQNAVCTKVEIVDKSIFPTTEMDNTVIYYCDRNASPDEYDKRFDVDDKIYAILGSECELFVNKMEIVPHIKIKFTLDNIDDKKVRKYTLDNKFYLNVSRANGKLGAQWFSGILGEKDVYTRDEEIKFCNTHDATKNIIECPNKKYGEILKTLMIEGKVLRYSLWLTQINQHILQEQFKYVPDIRYDKLTGTTPRELDKSLLLKCDFSDEDAETVLNYLYDSNDGKGYNFSLDRNNMLRGGDGKTKEVKKGKKKEISETPDYSKILSDANSYADDALKEKYPELHKEFIKDDDDGLDFYVWLQGYCKQKLNKEKKSE